MKDLLPALILFISTSFVYAADLPVGGETPGSLACIYGLTKHVPGCKIANATTVPTTGSGLIVVIEGADNPNAYTELTEFSHKFGLHQLPQCSGGGGPPCFETYYAQTCKVAGSPGSGPAPQQSGDLEPEIDVQWAHAMAPYASIYMIEAQSWQIDDIMVGVNCGNSLLAATGGGIMSISVSFPEFAAETTYDSNFKTPGVIYIASAGDYSAPARYPATSPNIIAAGGTMIQRDHAGNYIRQVAWVDTRPCTNPPCKTGGTGGYSLYESRPSFQNSVQKIVGNKRGTPDISFAAANIDVFCCLLNNGVYTNNCPATSTTCPTDGVYVRNGGTSLASPALAGIINSAHSGAKTTAEELAIIYGNAAKNYHTYWTDITVGNNGYPALQGYDLVSGLGVPKGYGGK